ncbi:MAG: hypothetical protein [aquatic viral metagenome]
MQVIDIFGQPSGWPQQIPINEPGVPVNVELSNGQTFKGQLWVIGTTNYSILAVYTDEENAITPDGQAATISAINGQYPSFTIVIKQADVPMSVTVDGGTVTLTLKEWPVGDEAYIMFESTCQGILSDLYTVISKTWKPGYQLVYQGKSPVSGLYYLILGTNGSEYVPATTQIKYNGVLYYSSGYQSSSIYQQEPFLAYTSIVEKTAINGIPPIGTYQSIRVLTLENAVNGFYNGIRVVGPLSYQQITGEINANVTKLGPLSSAPIGGIYRVVGKVGPISYQQITGEANENIIRLGPLSYQQVVGTSNGNIVIIGPIESKIINGWYNKITLMELEQRQSSGPPVPPPRPPPPKRVVKTIEMASCCDGGNIEERECFNNSCE